MYKKRIINKLLFCVIILILIGICVSPSSLSSKVNTLIISPLDKNVLYVDNNFNETTPGWNVTHFNKINNAINVANNSDTIYVYSGTYNEWIRLQIKLSIKGVKNPGEDFPIINGGNDHDTVIVYANGCLIENLKVRNGPSGFLETGVTFKSDNNILNHCYIWNTGTSLEVEYSNNNTIYNNTMTKGHYGIKVSGSNNTFSNNYIYGHNTHEIDVSGPNNFFFNNRVVDAWSRNGFEVYGNNCTFSENIIESNGKRGIHLKRSYNHTIVDNAFIDNGIAVTGDCIEHWSTHIIYNNTVESKPIYYYINEKNIEVPSDAGQIFLINCSECIIKDLVMEYSDTCINLIYSSNNTIINNRLLRAYADEGIYLFNSHFNVISDNVIHNIMKGIYMQESKYNKFIGNVIQDCNRGMDIHDNSDNNEIFLNDFLNYDRNDDINVIGWECTNIWDNGERGNYWCDYWWKYPWASIIWSKGVYNVPYFVDVYPHNVDHYPLVKPYNKIRTRSNIDVENHFDFIYRFLDMFPLLQKILNNILTNTLV